MKNFLLGLGISLISVSIIFYIANFIQVRAYRSQINELTMNIQDVVDVPTDELIIERAELLGMVFPVQAEPEPIPEPPDPPITQLEDNEPEMDISATYEPYDESEDTEDTDVEDADTEDSETEEVFNEISEPVLPDPEPPVVAAPVQTFVTLTIPPGSSAMVISRILVDNGVISNAQAFQNFVSSQQSTTSLRAGTMTFPRNTTNAEALRILTTIP